LQVIRASGVDSVKSDDPELGSSSQASRERERERTKREE
jgi:hypothetical protein